MTGNGWVECPALRRVGVAPRGSRPPCPVTDSLARFCLGFDALLRLDIFRVLAQRGLLQAAWSDADASGVPHGLNEQIDTKSVESVRRERFGS